MLSIEDLINQIKSYNPNADFDLIKKSYDYGFNAHKGQYRAQVRYILLILFRLQKL